MRNERIKNEIISDLSFHKEVSKTSNVLFSKVKEKVYLLDRRELDFALEELVAEGKVVDTPGENGTLYNVV